MAAHAFLGQWARTTGLALVLLVGAASGAPCLADDAPKPSAGPVRDFESILADGVLRVAITRFDIPPFHVRRTDGTYIGNDIELIDRLAQAMGIKAVLVDDAPTFDAVAAGRADIGLSKLSETYRRLHKVRFSQPYSTFRHALLYERSALSSERPGAAPEVALRDFRGRIGVIGASAYVEFAKASYPGRPASSTSRWGLPPCGSARRSTSPLPRSSSARWSARASGPSTC